MNINDIFLKRKKRWGTINRLRDSEEQADGSLTPSRRIALISDDKSFRERQAIQTAFRDMRKRLKQTD